MIPGPAVSLGRLPLPGPHSDVIRYTTCPKCGHTRAADEPADAGRCPRCGLVYAKWFRSRFHIRRTAGEGRDDSVGPGLRWRALILPDDALDGGVVYLYALLWLGLLLWGGYLVRLDYYYFVDGHRIDAATPPIYESFLHNVNLVFHEAGHVLFRPLGDFMAILGGSLLQVLMPLVVTVAFLFREGNPFGASVGLWWTGQSLMDLAPYINDARARQIPLLGGGDGRDRPGMHDWYNLLAELGWLEHDHAIAAMVDRAGAMLMLLALAWGGALLWRGFARNRR